MTGSSLQPLQVFAELPCNLLRHSKSDDQCALWNAVAIDGYGGEGDVNDAAALVHFGDEVGVEGRGSSIEEEHPFPIQVLGLSDGSTDCSFGHFSTFENSGETRQ